MAVLSSCTCTESTQPVDPTGTPPGNPAPPEALPEAPPAPPVAPVPPFPPAPPFAPPTPPAPAVDVDVGAPEPVGPVTGYEFMGGNVPVGTGPGVIIVEVFVGLAEAPDFPLPPPPEPLQAYAVKPIRTSGIPNRRIRRRQYTAGGRGPTGRRNDPTGGHPMACKTPHVALHTPACSTMRR